MQNRQVSALAVLVALALPGPAAGDVVQDLTISASPTKASTEKTRRSVTMKVSTGTRETTGAQPPSTARVTLGFPQGSVWNGAKFPTCSASAISAEKSTEACPSGSIIGKGTAAGLSPGPVFQDDLTIVIANGGASGVSMFVEGTSPLRIQSNIVAKIKKLSGTYGMQLDVPIPRSLQEPAPGVPVAVTKFAVTVGKSMKIGGTTRGIIEIDRCDNGKWSGEGVFTYSSGATITERRSIRCSKG